MTPLRHILITLVLSLCACSIHARADQVAPAPNPRAAADALFDRAAELLPKDPAASKSLFTRAAAAYERLIPLSEGQLDRASLSYNAGAAHQLAGDTGRAVLAFRRAQLLAPITPGLSERLAAARAQASGSPETVAAAPTTDTSQWLLDLARSIPRSIRWGVLAAASTLFWLLLLLRITIPAGAALRPRPLHLWIPAIICLLTLPTIAALWRADSLARRDAVILVETTPRSQPDDRIGAPSTTAPFKTGRELHILEETSGGDGQPWLRVSESREADPEAAPIWIPASAAARVLDQNTQLLDSH